VRTESRQSSLWIWPFELEAKIGEGGMGVVYRGRYVKNDRRVAVKLLPEEVADQTILARFEREVEILKSLHHPNIVHSFGGICEDTRRFYAMELVEGGSLETLLKSRGGRLTWERTIEFGLQMCAALQHAHDKGIIHRDLKPSNFLMTQSGTLKLSDFGLATVSAGHKLTERGKTVGSFRYMAPEQVRGKPQPVPQTDLYALGCVLFQMVTGRTPFDGTTAAELLNKHLTAPPPRPSEFAPDCPAALDTLIHSLLQKAIEDRPASAADVSATLRTVSLTTVAGAQNVGRVPAAQQPRTDTDTIRRRARIHRELFSSRFPRWLTLGLLLLVIVLTVGTVHLVNKNRRLQRAEDLWIQAYKSGEWEARQQAAAALGKLASDSDRALETLEQGLDTDDPRIRAATVQALGDAGAPARGLVPRFINLQKTDNDRRVRLAAVEALNKIRRAEQEKTSSGWMPTLLLLLAVAGGMILLWRRAVRNDNDLQTEPRNPRRLL